VACIDETRLDPYALLRSTEDLFDEPTIDEPTTTFAPHRHLEMT